MMDGVGQTANHANCANSRSLVIRVIRAIRAIRGSFFVSVVALVLAAAALAAGLAHYDSPKLPTSKSGMVYSISYHEGWSVAWGGE
ncbi:MAG TPA: hypothetical protein VHF22_04260, partial [Planctomycetota bacterium]|nr:hypothetical protein [Planctomycetota bacterium]